jgi:5-methylcytosine-specific restriction endonuclease McrA
VPAPSSQNGARFLAPRTGVTILRLCPRCGATLDPQVEGHRGPCRPCERKRSRERRATGSAAVRVRDQRRWKTIAQAAKARDRHQCRQCGSTKKLEAHHIVPLAEGGAAYDLENVVTLCAACHHKCSRSKGR